MDGKSANNDDYKSSRLIQMEKIITEHETALLRYATRIVNNPTLAEDVVQNVFIKLFKAWKPGTRPSAKLKSWLYRVTHNEAVDHIRRESRLRNLHEKHTEEKRNNSCSDAHKCYMSHEEQIKLALSHVRELPHREQQVLLLRLQEGLSYREIADVTGRSVGNIGNILHHAVHKLSTKLQHTQTDRENLESEGKAS